MVVAMRANLKRIVQFRFIQRIFAFRTFYENAFRFYLALFVVDLLVDLWLVSFEPGHNAVGSKR